jgi:hypothetical protein
VRAGFRHPIPRQRIGLGYSRRRILIALPAIGNVHFDVSTDHNTAVVSYEARLYAQGGTTQVDSYNIGKPTPSSSSAATVNLYTWLQSHTAGNYVVRIAAVGSTGGTAESTNSNAFTIPLTSA